MLLSRVALSCCYDDCIFCADGWYLQLYTMSYYTISYCNPFEDAIFYSLLFCYITLHYIVLSYESYYITLYCVIMLYYIILCSRISRSPRSEMSTGIAGGEAVRSVDVLRHRPRNLRPVREPLKDQGLGFRV